VDDEKDNEEPWRFLSYSVQKGAVRRMRTRIRLLAQL
jgi:hypothetical protein